MLTIWYLQYLGERIKGVLSNVKLENLDLIGMEGKYKPLTDLKNINNYKGYILLTDEFRSIIDSRMSSSFKNLFISNLLRDTGKFKQIHILTDQDENAIDRRIRRNTDVVLHPTVNINDMTCTVKIFESYNQYYLIRGYDQINSWNIEFTYPIMDYAIFYDTEQKIEEYYISFEPREYYKHFRDWLVDTGYINHPDFMVKKSTLQLWKEENPDIGTFISGSQLSALLEYIKYNSDLPVYGRKKEKKR